MTRGRMVALVASAIVVIVAVVLAVSLGNGADAPERADIGLPDGERADDVTGSPAADGPSVSDVSTMVVTPDRESDSGGRIAYRLDGAIWVADEDGGDAHVVIESPDGPFALSPDGTSLALVDAGLGRLLLVVDVDERDRPDAVLADLGPAAADAPSWAPDSSWFAYTADSDAGLQVRTVRRSGDGDAVLDSGRSPHVSPDGSRIVYIESADTGTAGPMFIHTVDTGFVKRATAPLAVDLAWAKGSIVYSTPGADGMSPSLGTMSVIGVGAHEIVGPPSASRPVLYTRLCVSPDGAQVVYAHSGDDGYSRMYVVDIEDPEPVLLSVRRDDYPLCWAADGSRLFFIEGNPYQGEATDLMSVQPDGVGRRVIVEGAGL